MSKHDEMFSESATIYRLNISFTISSEPWQNLKQISTFGKRHLKLTKQRE